jgi:plasmid stabilization system protein ParE
LSRPVRITTQADGNIAKAQDWYEQRDPGLGTRFVLAVRDTTNRIASNPFTYQIAIEDARKAPVHGFPYGVWYRVLPDESVVIACLAHRRDVKLATKRVLQRLDT